MQSIARSSHSARHPQYQLWIGGVLIEIKNFAAIVRRRPRARALGGKRVMLPAPLRLRPVA
jgi:hypothetical protein